MYRMLQSILVIGIGLWLALGVHVPSAAAADVTVTGEIYADKEDSAGNVLSVVIVTEDDDEFLVTPSGKGEKLIAHIGSLISATGTVSSSGGDQTIDVTSFKVISPE